MKETIQKAVNDWYERTDDIALGSMTHEIDDLVDTVSQAVRLPLAKKHDGMKISASGILLRIRGQLKFGAESMDQHLKQMANRYYAGDLSAVDEFLQLYCLDDDRPEQMDSEG